MPGIRYFCLLVVLVSLVLPFPTRVSAQVDLCGVVQYIDWREITTQSFSILYPDSYKVIAQRLAARQAGQALDQEYARFAGLFGASLPLPLSIRIYPNVYTYTCLNPQNSGLPENTLLTHTGAREISLIGSNIEDNFAAWSQNDINILRYELAALFVKQISGDVAPPGLTTAVGRYIQDPQETIAYLDLNGADWNQPTYDWRALWENTTSSSELGRQLQAGSTVSYLVDTYGWDAFVQFLQSISKSRSFSQSLSQVYSANLDELEHGWQAYYPGYFRGGWQSHAIYNYNLDPYQELIVAEKYRDADQGLREAIAFIQKIQALQPDDAGEKLAAAYRLQQRAQAGQEAEYLWGQSQQAFQSGDYSGSLALLDQAEQKYAQTGNRMYHLDEFSAYRQQVVSVLALHAELDNLRPQLISQWNTFLLADRILELGDTLNRLGDRQGHEQVVAMAEVIEARQQDQYLFLAAMVIMFALILLTFRIYLSRKLPPPEAQL